MIGKIRKGFSLSFFKEQEIHTMTETPSILKAFALVNKDKTVETNSQSAPKPLPTAKSRKALDILVNSNPEDLKELPLRNFLQDLFNWDGNNHVNKPLIRAFQEAISDPKKYPQAVEFTGYAVALAPMLEADQIARMYRIVDETKTAFAPTTYTINFHSNLKRAFAGLSAARVEKIGESLWKESHNGRWWNMTAGIDNVQEGQGDVTPSKILKSLIEYNKTGNEGDHMENIIWSPQNQENFQKHISSKLNKDLAILSETFRKDLMKGEAVTPDIAIFLSSIPWLAPNQRPESPINSLLRTLVAIREDDDSFRMPKKPNTIKDLFPNLDFSTMAKFDFPFDPNIIRFAETAEMFKKAAGTTEKEFNLISSKTALAQNARHMGNCTLTYQKNMEQGKYALFYIKDGENEYNAAVQLRGNKWSVGEINSRFNRGGVSQNFRTAFNQAIGNLPPVSDQYKNYLDSIDKDGKKKSLTYSYIL